MKEQSMTLSIGEVDTSTTANSERPIRVVVVGAGSAALLAREVIQRKLGELVQVIEKGALAQEELGALNLVKSKRASDVFNIVSQETLDDASFSLCATGDDKPDRPAWVSPYGPSRTRGSQPKVKSSTKRTSRGR